MKKLGVSLMALGISLAAVGVIIAAWLFVGFLGKCIEQVNKDAVIQNTQIESGKDKAIKACTDRSGIPILSAWDGRLIRCEGIK